MPLKFKLPACCALLAFLILFQFPEAKADHILGAEITYTSRSANDSIYDVYLTFYRDCNGCFLLGQNGCGATNNCTSNLEAPNFLTVRCNTSGDTLGKVFLSRISISNITRTCDTVASRCDKPCNGTYPMGMEKHVFKGVLDLRQNFSSGCCDLELSVLLYSRHTTITTGPAYETFYSFARLNPCLGKSNSSPVLLVDPVTRLCCNTAFYYNMGAADTADHDSLSYALVTAYKDRNTACSYTFPYTYQNPITIYDPFKTGMVYPNASPPIGVYLDPQDGDLIFTPTRCDDDAVIVVEVTEWRKDTTGTYQKIGAIRRDMMFRSRSCAGNNSPVLTSEKYNYKACENQKICFKIEATDKVFVPPPPSPAPDTDTVTLIIKNGIPGSTVKILNPSEPEPKAEFCWTPPTGSASTIPYMFTATARDNNCPQNQSVTRSFSILVGNEAFMKLPNDTSVCCDSDTIKLQAIPAGGTWSSSPYPSAIDTSGHFFPTKACNPNGAQYSTIWYSYTDSSANCYGSESMKIVVNPLPKVVLHNATFCDDRATVNLNDDIVYVPANVGPNQTWNCLNCGIYDWSKILENIGSQNFPEYVLHIDKNTMDLGSKQSDSIVIEFVYGNAQGCYSRDTATIRIIKSPQITIPTLPELCWDDDIADLILYSGVKPDNGKWISYDTITSGVTRVTNDSLNGALKNNKLDPKKTSPAGGRYYMRYYHDATGCPAWRDTIITIHSLPNPKIAVSEFNRHGSGSPYALCDDDTSFQIFANPSGGAFSSDYSGTIVGRRFYAENAPVNIPFWVRYAYTDPVTSCRGFDSVEVIVHRLTRPEIIMSNDTLFSKYEYTSYSWFRNNIFTGVYDRFIVLKETGTYTLWVHNKYACDSWSAPFEVKEISVREIDPSHVVLYPNPAGKTILIDWSGSEYRPHTLRISDLQGREVLSVKTDPAESRYQIDVQHLSSGTYHISLDCADITINELMIVR